MLGWLSHSEDRPDVKINVIYPATDVHIRKVIPPRSMITTRTGVLNNSPLFLVQYSNQQVHIVRETPALYERIVKPYIDAFPASRTQWSVWPVACSAVLSIAHRFKRFHKYRIDEIISGRSEAEKVLFRSPPEADPFGFLILPDMKWALADLASLYLVALTLLPNIKSLRDLNLSHLPLLRSIRREATNI